MWFLCGEYVRFKKTHEYHFVNIVGKYIQWESCSYVVIVSSVEHMIDQEKMKQYSSRLACMSKN